jgi:hypothetical protein
MACSIRQNEARRSSARSMLDVYTLLTVATGIEQPPGRRIGDAH